MIFDAILTLLPQVTGTAKEYATALDTYLNGNDQPWSGQSTRIISKWTQMSNEDFSVRFTRAFNTFWIASQSTVYIADQTTMTLADFYNQTTGALYPHNLQAMATTTHTFEIYKADFVWITLLLVVSLVVVLCSLASLALRLVTKAPDILGYVSSLTRDSPYFRNDEDKSDAPASSALSGPERARVLRRLRVRIADVKAGEEVGYIAFAPESASTPSDQEPLLEKKRREVPTKGRLYE
jgi:hypothetical protein